MLLFFSFLFFTKGGGLHPKDFMVVYDEETEEIVLLISRWTSKDGRHEDGCEDGREVVGCHVVDGGVIVYSAQYRHQQPQAFVVAWAYFDQFRLYFGDLIFDRFVLMI